MPDTKEPQVRGFRDPWPAPEPEWRDPPWILEGRVVTAWSSIEWAVARQIISPDLLPPRVGEPLTIRLRFYDIRFAPAREDSAGPDGRFREAVVAIAGSIGEVEGEVSLFMWTDSSTYLAWGREVFGWPLRNAEFSFAGPLWQAGELPREPSAAADVTGTSRATSPDGTVAVEIHGTEPMAGGVRPAVWITPRRIVRAAGCAQEEREVLLVRPEILDSGRLYEAAGTANLAFRAGHPLSGLPFPALSLDVVDGFRIVVGAHVDVITEKQTGGARSHG